MHKDRTKQDCIYVVSICKLEKNLYSLTTGEAFLWCKVLYSHKVIACMMTCSSSFGQTASNSTINTD